VVVGVVVVKVDMRLVVEVLVAIGRTTHPLDLLQHLNCLVVLLVGLPSKRHSRLQLERLIPLQ